MSKVSTIQQLQQSACAHLNPHLFEEDKPGKEKRSKYGAVKMEVDGIVFDSTKEGNRYIELRYLLKAGEILDLRLQVPYELNEGGSFSRQYIADFVYIDNRTGEEIVEDVKGYRIREYKKNKRLMLKVHNIKIKEV